MLLAIAAAYLKHIFAISSCHGNEFSASESQKLRNHSNIHKIKRRQPRYGTNPNHNKKKQKQQQQQLCRKHKLPHAAQLEESGIKGISHSNPVTVIIILLTTTTATTEQLNIHQQLMATKVHARKSAKKQTPQQKQPQRLAMAQRVKAKNRWSNTRYLFLLH